MTYLPDVNLWIALTIAEHVHHQTARHWFEAAADDIIAFCRVTQIGFLRLLTNNKVMAADVLTPARAWHVLERLQTNYQVVFASEPVRLDQIWRKITASQKSGTNFWTDTYLAAFAQASGFTLVTFDQGFSKYKTLPIRLLG